MRSFPPVPSCFAFVAALLCPGSVGHAAPTAQGGPCTPDWEATFGETTWTNGQVAAVFDDGKGPELCVGGAFNSAGGVLAANVARWNGTRWAPLGSGLPGEVKSLAVFDGGNGAALYAGGNFSGSGFALARWDGGTWSPVGTFSPSASVNVLRTFDDGNGAALYVGGTFTVVDGLATNYIARWDGTNWSALGSGLAHWPYALTGFDDGSGPALYVGGGFVQAGGVAVNRIARWDGTSWSPLGSGLGAAVLSLQVFDDGSGPALFAGGPFTDAGGQPAKRIARWNGTSWTQVGSGLDRSVTALTTFDDGSGPALFAAGNRIQSLTFLSKWTGLSWIPIGAAIGHGEVTDVAVFDDGVENELYVLGALSTDDGISEFAHMAKWNGEHWSRVGGGLDNSVTALTAFDDGGGNALYAGGAFRSAGNTHLDYVGKWDGTSWSALGAGLAGVPRVLAVLQTGNGPVLYAGGAAPGGFTRGFVDAWDGTSWIPLGGTFDQAFDQTVLALATFDDGNGLALYAGGGSGSQSPAHPPIFARWTGATWSSIPGAPNGIVNEMLAFDDGSGPALYVGGVFPQASSSQRYIVRWDGANWSSLGTGTNGSVCALTVLDDGNVSTLIAGGAFTSAGGVAVNNVARWDGVSWSPLGGGTTYVNSLATFDDGNGSRLYAAGGATLGPYMIARFDGTNWSQLGSGVNNIVNALAVFDAPGARGPALIAGGEFTSALDSTDSFVAAWQGCLDTLAPVITAPSSVFVLDRGAQGEFVTFSVSASDDTDPAPAVVCVPPSGSFFGPGTTLVTCTAHDTAGNATQSQFSVVLAPKLRARGR